MFIRNFLAKRDVIMISDFKMEFAYEHFIRKAFSLDNKRKKMIDCYGDPARLATTNVFADENICLVKAAVAYAIAIFNSHILLEKIPLSHSISVQEELETYIQKLFDTTTKFEIYDLIKQYNKIRKTYLKIYVTTVPTTNITPK
jgi:hypothetical protein